MDTGDDDTDDWIDVLLVVLMWVALPLSLGLLVDWLTITLWAWGLAHLFAA